jgi:Tol biopolymer transport system component
MTTDDRLERTMSAWLREDAPFRVSDHLDEVLSVTSETRQRPAWSSLERWLPVDTTFRPRLFHAPRLSQVLLVAALLVALLGLLLFAVGSQRQRLPEPFGPARNGIFVTSRDGDLYTIDPTTSRSAPLALGDGFDFSPIFSRDGTRIVFLRSDGPLTEPAILTMMVANADGSDLHAVTPPTQSLDWFDWSPDGTKIAYMATGQLWVADARGGEPLMLPGARPAHFPTWLPPDGREIVYRLEGDYPAVFAIRPDGTGRHPISVSDPNNRFDYQSLGVSPDGSKVTFTRWSNDIPDIDNGWLPRVYAVDVATGKEMPFPTASGTGQRGAVAYSPDGKLVAYARIHREGAFQIVVANADGSGNERTLGPKKPGPADGSDVDATWAFTPDGTALLVRYGNDNAGATHMLPLDGSPGSILVDAGGFEFVDVQRLAP